MKLSSITIPNIIVIKETPKAFPNCNCEIKNWQFLAFDSWIGWIFDYQSVFDFTNSVLWWVKVDRMGNHDELCVMNFMFNRLRRCVYNGERRWLFWLFIRNDPINSMALILLILKRKFFFWHLVEKSWNYELVTYSVEKNFPRMVSFLFKRHFHFANFQTSENIYSVTAFSNDWVSTFTSFVSFNVWIY